MKIPKKVKIGSITYTIKVGKDMPKNRNDAVGHTSWQREEIEIFEGKPEYMFATFLHEVLHTFNVLDDDLRLQNLADRLHSFIKDNPEVFK